MKNKHETNNITAGTNHLVVLHNDLAKLNTKEKQAIESKTELKGLYGKECHFYEFYFLAVAADPK